MATVETCKEPTKSSPALKEQHPKRDFLREHREYLRNIQKRQKSAKTNSTENSEALTKDFKPNAEIRRKRAGGVRRDIWKTEVLNRLTAKTDRTKLQVGKPCGTCITDNTELREKFDANSNMLDICVQTCNPELESFLEGARILTPSDAVLEAIRAVKEPPPEAKPHPVKRKIDRHACTLNAHLSDLKEFLEISSVSRRKRYETQPMSNIKKFLPRGRINSLKRTNPPSIEPQAKKVTNENRILENVKSSFLCGVGESAMKTTVNDKVSKFPRRESIGDGPKCPGRKKLAVVY